MKNNKTLYIVIGVVVVVLIGILAFITQNPGGQNNTGGATSTNEVAGNQSSASPMSLKDLYASGASQQCAFSSQDPVSASVAGTVFVTSGHMRGDFSVNASGTVIASHMIADGDNAYVWSDANNQGVKMSFASMSSEQSSASSHTAVNADQKMDYNCGSWTPDNSKFTVPTSVQFQDMSAMMNAAAGASVSGSVSGSQSAQMCAMCAQAGSASAQAQCRAALHC